MAIRPRPSARACDEARRLVRAQARIVDDRLRAWCADPHDRDALHDGRTALRRLRVLLRSFRADLGSLARRRTRRDLRAAFRLTSGLRDRDVFVAWLMTMPPSRARRHLLEADGLGTDDRAVVASRELWPRWDAAFRQLKTPRRKVVAGLGRRRAFGFAAAAALRREAQAVSAGLGTRAVPRASADLHALRIATKRLRYLLEAVAAEAAETRRPVEWCRLFQDLAGNWRDASLAVRHVRSCPAVPGRDRLLARVTGRRRTARADLHSFVADRAAWDIAHDDVLGWCRRVRRAADRGRGVDV